MVLVYYYFQKKDNIIYPDNIISFNREGLFIFSFGFINEIDNKEGLILFFTLFIFFLIKKNI